MHHVFLEDEFDICVIDRPLYINFIITKKGHRRDDHNNIKIQLMKIYFRNMAEIFVTYHSGIVCVAFDVTNNNYIHMPQRFGKMNFTNFLCMAGKYKICDAYRKYIKRFHIFYKTNKHLIKNIIVEKQPSHFRDIFGFGEEIFYEFAFTDQYMIGESLDISILLNKNFGSLNNIYSGTEWIENIVFFDIIYMAYKLFADLPASDVYSSYIENTHKIKSFGVSCVLCELYLGSLKEIITANQQKEIITENQQIENTFSVCDHIITQTCSSTYDNLISFYYRCPKFELDRVECINKLRKINSLHPTNILYADAHIEDGIIDTVKLVDEYISIKSAKFV